MVRLKPSERPLYIVAPSLAQCHRAARAHGIEPSTMVNVRCITSAYQLRGTRPGTPFITHERSLWVKALSEIYHLDLAIDTLVRTGRLRPAGSDDIKAACGAREAAE